MGYNVTAKWIKEPKYDAPDALSHHRVCDSKKTEVLAELDTHDNPDISMTEIRAIKTRKTKVYIYKSYANMLSKMSNTNCYATSY